MRTYREGRIVTGPTPRTVRTCQWPRGAQKCGERFDHGPETSTLALCHYHVAKVLPTGSTNDELVAQYAQLVRTYGWKRTS
jgi:hypothetical protein